MNVNIPWHCPAVCFMRCTSAHASLPVTILSTNFCTSRFACCHTDTEFLKRQAEYITASHNHLMAIIIAVTIADGPYLTQHYLQRWQ